jgi:hypothetical protein
MSDNRCPGDDDDGMSGLDYLIRAVEIIIGIICVFIIGGVLYATWNYANQQCKNKSCSPGQQNYLRIVFWWD